MMGRIGGLASREVLYPSLGSLRAVLARARYFCCINAIHLLSVHGSAEGGIVKTCHCRFGYAASLHAEPS